MIRFGEVVGVMAGKIISRMRYLWIIIVLSVLLLGAAIVLLVYSGRSGENIPQKGVFVLGERGKT